MSSGITLELGDVINIQHTRGEITEADKAPLLIQYISSSRIELMNLDSGDVEIYDIVNGRITDRDVYKIILLTRNPFKGYAAQNGLNVGKGVRIGFNGASDILEGEILTVDGDAITVLLNDTLEIIYIDFQYKGLPDELEIKYIEAYTIEKPNLIKENAITEIKEYLKDIDFTSEQMSLGKLAKKIISEKDGFTEDMKPWVKNEITKYITELVNAEEKMSNLENEKIENIVIKHLNTLDLVRNKKSTKELANEIISREEGLTEENRYLVRSIINDYIQSGYTGKKNQKVLKKTEEEKEKELQRPINYGQVDKKEEPIIGITQQTKSQLAHEIKQADHMLEKELHPDQEHTQKLVDELFEDDPTFSQAEYKFTKVFSLEEQITDMLDDFLSKIPTEQRTATIFNKIHTIIQRYTQLRKRYIVNNTPFKPMLYDSLYNLNRETGWIFPVVEQTLVKDIFTATNKDEEEEVTNKPKGKKGKKIAALEQENEGIPISTFESDLENLTTEYDNAVENRYEDYLLKMDTIFSNVFDRNNEDAEGGPHQCIVKSRVGGDIPVVYNLDSGLFFTRYLATPLYKEPYCMSSIITMPYFVARFSRVNGSMTNLYEQSNFTYDFNYLNLFRMLNRYSNINTVYAGSEDNQIDRNEINRYTIGLNQNINNLLESVVNTEMNIKKYLKSINHKTNGVGFSLYSLIRQLEPFQLYYDNLHQPQAISVWRANKRRIKEYKENLEETTQAFGELERKMKEIADQQLVKQPLLDIFDESQPFRKSIMYGYTGPVNDYYFFDLDKRTPTELLGIINSIDCGRYYSYSVVLQRLLSENINNSNWNKPPTVNLPNNNTATAINTSVDIPPPLTASNIQTNIPEKTQITRNIPLTKVGGVVIDDRDDDTFTAESVETPEQTVEFSEITKPDKQPSTVYPVNVLPIGKKGTASCKNVEVVKLYTDIQDIHADNNYEINTTLLMNERPVKEEDYAVLLEGPNAISYYKRTNNRWDQDTSIQPTMLYDTPAMFCNLGLWCVRDFTNKKCSSTQEFTNHIVQKLISEMDGVPPINNLDMSQEEYQRVLNQDLLQISKHFRNNKLKYSIRQWILGKTREYLEVVTSPNLDLFIAIMGETNYAKRQQDIVNFCVQYTRKYDPSNNLETPYWRYCKDTQVQLVPTSIFTIASLYNTYSNNIPKYQEELELLKKEIGMMSEDGAYVIDKYTGFKISEKNFDYSEDYDDAGFVIKTREVLVDEEKLEEEIKLKKELMSTNTSILIRKIIGFVTEQMHIRLHNDVEFIVRIVSNVLKINAPKDVNTYILFLTLGMINIAIQTSIPSVVSRKTFPGCKENFYGYPLSGNKEDMESINYITCIIIKAKQSSPPWNILRKFKSEKDISEIIRDMTSKFLETEPEVLLRIRDKTAYLLSSSANPQFLIPYEHDIHNWDTYLPILSDITKMGRIEQPAREKIYEVMNNPNTKNINFLISKIYEYSVSIQSKVQTVIKKKAGSLLLKTALGIPFVENSCCIDHTHSSTYGYFVKEDPSIEQSNKIANDLTTIMRKMVFGLRSPQIVSFINTKRIYPEIGTAMSADTIYAAFAHQLRNQIIKNFGKEPENSNTEESEQKYTIDIFGSIEENVARIKNSGIVYSKEEFEKLLQNRFSENIVPSKEIYGVPRNTLLDLREELRTLFQKKQEEETEEEEHTEIEDETENTILPTDFLQLFYNVTHTTSKNYKAHLSKLKTYLNDKNTAMLNSIKTHMRKSKSKMLDYFEGALENFVTEEMFLDMVHNFIVNLTQVFPSISIHSAKSENSIVIPKYWRLSESHKNDLKTVLLKRYDTLKSINDLKEVHPILKFMIRNTKSLLSIVDKSCKYYKELNRENTHTALDLPAVKLLMKYFVYTIYYQYIVLGSEQNISEKKIDHVLHLFFEIFMDEKIIINKKLSDIADAVINIRNIEKNRMLEELSILTSDQHSSNKVLKSLKLKRWSVPKNLRKYSKSGYDADKGIFDEDDAFTFGNGGGEDEGYDMEDSMEDDERQVYDLDEEPLGEFDDFETYLDEIIGEEGESPYGDGIFDHVDIEEMSPENA